MKIEIVSVNDENFSIKVAQMGDVFVACDGHCSCIGKCEKDAVEGLTNMLESNARVKERQEVAKEEVSVEPLTEQQLAFIKCKQGCGCVDVCEEEIAPQQGKPAVPLENPKQTNSFDWFSGTSWGGSKQSFN